VMDDIIKMEGVIKLDPGKQPKQFHLTQIVLEVGNNKGMNGVDDFGIYDLAGDKLKVCYASERPVEFNTKPGTRQKLHVFRRAKEAELKWDKDRRPTWGPGRLLFYRQGHLRTMTPHGSVRAQEGKKSEPEAAGSAAAQPAAREVLTKFEKPGRTWRTHRERLVA